MQPRLLVKEKTRHIDYCRGEANGPCDRAELQHVSNRIVPQPDGPKDTVAHNLAWRKVMRIVCRGPF